MYLPSFNLVNNRFTYLFIVYFIIHFMFLTILEVILGFSFSYRYYSDDAISYTKYSTGKMCVREQSVGLTYFSISPA